GAAVSGARRRAPHGPPWRAAIVVFGSRRLDRSPRPKVCLHRTIVPWHHSRRVEPKPLPPAEPDSGVTRHAPPRQPHGRPEKQGARRGARTDRKAVRQG